MICSWLSNSPDDPIRATVSRLTNAKMLWDCLKTRYTMQNGPRIYKLWSDLTTYRQSGNSIVMYCTKFLGMCEDLTNLTPLSSASSDGDAPIFAWFANLKTY